MTRLEAVVQHDMSVKLLHAFTLLHGPNGKSFHIEWSITFPWGPASFPKSVGQEA